MEWCLVDSSLFMKNKTNIFLAFRQFNRAFQTESMEGYFTIYFSTKLIIIGNNNITLKLSATVIVIIRSRHIHKRRNVKVTTKV